MRSKISAFILPIVCVAGPVSAQTVKPVNTSVQLNPSPDRIAASKPVIDKLWQLGTYRKLIGEQMTEMVNAMMESMYGMNAEDVVPSETVDVADRGKSLGQLAEKKDPHFRERMRIMVDVMFKEMAPLMDKVEPSVRASLTSIYARKFTVAELNDLDRFFATPTGKLYADQWLMNFYDPEIMKSMQGFMPEMMKMMPQIMEKFEKATAHLPPPQKENNADATDAAAAAAEAASSGNEEGQDEQDMRKRWSAVDRQAIETMEQNYEKLFDEIEIRKLDARERTGEKLSEEDKDYRRFLQDRLKAYPKP